MEQKQITDKKQKRTKITWKTHWVDRFGTPILFTEMGNNHLCKTLEMLYRNAYGARQAAIETSRLLISDETGLVHKRKEEKLLSGKHDMEFIHPAFPGLYQEAKIRGLLDTLNFPLWIE